jgi:sulfur oxidation c-type cytochrome SoxX
MKRTIFANIVLTLVVAAVLYFVVTEGMALWESFSVPPQGAGQAASPDIYFGMTPAQVGQLAFTTAGCLSCHNVNLQGGVVGPSLDNVANRRADPDWLRKQILTPPQVIPGSYMPIFPELSDQEVQGLIAYLHTLDPTHSSKDNQGPVQLSPPPGVSIALAQHGEEVFKIGSCVGCHTINGVSESGSIGPNLTHEASRLRTDEWQLKHLKNPLSVYVAGEPDPNEVSWPMPREGGMQLSDEDLQALVAYMQSLK